MNLYKLQNRGGVGMSGVKLHDDDFVEHIAMTSTHDFHLFFTNLGRVFKLKGYTLPSGSRQSKGVPIVNYLNFQKGEKLALQPLKTLMLKITIYSLLQDQNVHINNYNIRQKVLYNSLREDDEQ